MNTVLSKLLWIPHGIFIIYFKIILITKQRTFYNILLFVLVCFFIFFFFIFFIYSFDTLEFGTSCGTLVHIFEFVTIKFCLSFSSCRFIRLLWKQTRTWIQIIYCDVWSRIADKKRKKTNNKPSPWHWHNSMLPVYIFMSKKR